jgi:competence protein ComEC
VKYFGKSLASDILAAPHHGSKNGISREAMALINPHSVLISAGVNNQYGHPDTEATNLFGTYSEQCYSTSYGDGQSMETVATAQEVKSYKFIN